VQGEKRGLETSDLLSLSHGLFGGVKRSRAAFGAGVLA
jgi:hypothetical protein